MAKYSYITDKTHNNRKIQVESAKRDGSGKNIENNYAKQNGNYQSLTAGLSNNFDTKLTEKDESAYNFRPTATMGSMELEVGSPCKVKKIVGGSVAFNQLCVSVSDATALHTTTKSVSGDTITLTIGQSSSTAKGADFAINVAKGLGHKLFLSADLYSSTGSINFGKLYSATTRSVTSEDGKFTRVSLVTNDSYNVSKNVGVYYFDNTTEYQDNVVLKAKNVMCIDLTQMFGSTIADYIYSLEQANAGSGVAWFKRYFPKECYAYNGGELVSVKTQGKKITHFNQWDEEWEVGGYDVSGNAEVYPTTIRSKQNNYIKVEPNAVYFAKTNGNKIYIASYDENKNFISYLPNANGLIDTTFTTPSNCAFIRFQMSSTYGTTYNHDICINFHYDGERDGEYEPYNSETYPCDDVELRGIPQLDENNNLAFDGDEYTADGNVKRKYGIVDLGTLEWGYNSSSRLFNATLLGGTTSLKLLCALYTPYELSGDGNDPDMCMYVYQNKLYITNSSYTDSQTLTTAMSGVYLIYELATTTDENSIPFTEVQECDNWGTEEWLAPTTDTRPCEVPVGHETDYLPDLKAKVEVAPTTPNENGVYVMEHNASGNSYTPIATWLADNGYVKPTSISGYDNTKTQTLKNVEGVLTWVDDE